MRIIIRFQNLIKLIRVFANMRNYHFYKFPLKDAFKGQKAYVLVNGPSLKKAFKDYDEGLCSFDSNSFFVNLSPLDSHFFKIKPKHFCLSDPMFYQDFYPKKDDIRRMYKLLQQNVDWDLNLYINFYYEWEYKKIIEYSQISNPHIKFVRMNRNKCDILDTVWRNRLYNTTWFQPEDGTIANLAIYIALLEGYKEIELYGADHNQFLEFRVNEKNELCSYDGHFYDDGKPQLKPFKNCNSTKGIVWRVHEFMYIIYVMFNSHNQLRQFADYKGAHVLNCTPGSMIDSYDRKAGC